MNLESQSVGALSPSALLTLLRLSSASLPIGAFAYSQGLEQAVAEGSVHDRVSAEAWVAGLLSSSVLTCDLPVLLRLQRAWASLDLAAVRYWNDLLFVMRPSHELREEERQLGGALFRFLAGQGHVRAESWLRDPRATLAAAFALAGDDAQSSPAALALAYGFAWAEAQVGAATRLVPLGQTDAQRVLSGALVALEAGLAEALLCEDSFIAATAPGQAILSAAHESQYSRLFRS